VASCWQLQTAVPGNQRLVPATSTSNQHQQPVPATSTSNQ